MITADSLVFNIYTKYEELKTIVLDGRDNGSGTIHFHLP